MRIGYALYTYKDPPLIAKLARELLTGQQTASITIHHDANREPLGAFTDDPRLNIVPDPVKVRYGHWSQVEAIVKTVRLMLDASPEVDWIVLLTGQDWPVVPLAEIESKLDTLTVDACIDAVTSSQWGWDAVRRYGYRWYNVPDWLARFGPAIGHIRGLAYESHYGTFQINRIGFRSTRLGRRDLVGGSEYFMMSRKVWKIVDAAFDDRRENRAFRRALIPTEVFFATVLADAGVRIGASLRYQRWRPGLAHPDLLEASDAEAARASGGLFARKVSADTVETFAAALTALTR